jgi:hypothetical protein
LPRNHASPSDLHPGRRRASTSRASLAASRAKRARALGCSPALRVLIVISALASPEALLVGRYYKLRPSRGVRTLLRRAGSVQGGSHSWWLPASVWALFGPATPADRRLPLYRSPPAVWGPGSNRAAVTPPPASS